MSRKNKSFVPLPLGVATNSLMNDYFSDIINIEFTAKMESDLDKIAAGDIGWTRSMEDFYGIFDKTLQSAEKEMGNGRIEVEDEVSDVKCDKCGRFMVVKNGRFGKFLACPGYPECKNTRRIEEKAPPKVSDQVCELCGKPMVIKNGRYGQFLACSGFPECRNIRTNSREYPSACPSCGGDLVQRFTKKHKSFYGCKNYPKCDFSSWDEPANEKCPNCGKTLFMKKSKNGDRMYCSDEKCGYSVDVKTEEKKER